MRKLTDIEKIILEDLINGIKISLDNYPLTEVLRDKKVKQFVYIITGMERDGLVEVSENYYTSGGRTDDKYQNCAVGIIDVNNRIRPTNKGIQSLNSATNNKGNY